MLAAPPEVIRRRIHGAYQEILANQWGCAAIPADWLHLTLCGAATGVNADDQEHAAEQLTARLREGAGDKLLQGIELVLGPATVNADGVQLDINSLGPTGPEVFEACDEPLG
ncbi:hypothetical protein ACIA5G_39135 [Amycolatopsis sp. NPDC051758]|uniref:hypothetical protein n=1 Tax=Amycolatopsis sp. NPDC051758 TaxID=3363935 RepID=UPI0037BB2965